MKQGCGSEDSSVVVCVCVCPHCCLLGQRVLALQLLKAWDDYRNMTSMSPWSQFHAFERKTLLFRRKSNGSCCLGWWDTMSQPHPGHGMCCGLLLATKPVCVCCLTLSDALVTKTPFCGDSVWVMLIRAGVWDLSWAIWFESNKGSLWIPAQSTNEACSMLTRWESLANSLNLFQAPLGFQVFILDHKPKHPGRGSCCHISSPSDKALASKQACCCKIPTLP